MRTRKLGKPKLVDLFGEEWHEKYIHPDLRVEDVRLLEAASRKKYHLVDVPLVLALTGWQPRKAQRRLQFLTKHKYLTRYFIPEFRQRARQYAHVYELAKAGGRVLKIVRGGSLEDFLTARRGAAPSYLFAPHTVELGRVRLALERSAKSMNATLPVDVDDRQLARTFRGWPALPDGYLNVLLPNGAQAHFFLEHDRATADIAKVWAGKFASYAKLWFGGFFRDAFSGGNVNVNVGFRVLVTVPDEARLRSLLRACIKHVVVADYRQMFYFALLRDVESHNAFAYPIWWRSDLDRPIALL